MTLYPGAEIIIGTKNECSVGIIFEHDGGLYFTTDAHNFIDESKESKITLKNNDDYTPMDKSKRPEIATGYEEKWDNLDLAVVKISHSAVSYNFGNKSDLHFTEGRKSIKDNEDFIALKLVPQSKGRVEMKLKNFKSFGVMYDESYPEMQVIKIKPVSAGDTLAKGDSGAPVAIGKMYAGQIIRSLSDDSGYAVLPFETLWEAVVKKYKDAKLP
ncbi:hypothetical protein AKO1_007169 [Acrasis kona]|uniref:Peptidase S1 domain-containing protein n=1 Tax=Acrasis kona TaxID=1008807 RepID=A0AAW2YUC6_9EUKA